MNFGQKETLERAIASCLEYILSRQAKDGSWGDWKLPPGESRLWTTAFVGCKMRWLPSHLRGKVTTSVHAAARWLLNNKFADDGWGYNDRVGSDADSTAHAILFLTWAGGRAPQGSYARLREFQCTDGGFSTYLSDSGINSWVVSHPDVSPIALLALLTNYSCDECFVQRGLQYVRQQRTSAGLWNSFWWDSFLYSTEANLSLLNAVGSPVDTATTKESLARVRSAKAFEIALQISSLISDLASPETEAHPFVHQLVNQLVREQQADGSWKSQPVLRVTRRDCYEPWNCQESGPLFSDPNKLFTSSTVLDALSKVYLRSCCASESRS